MNKNLVDMKAWLKNYPLQASLFLLAFLAYPLVIISPQGTTLFREVFLFRLPVELLMSGLSLSWIIKNSDKFKLKSFSSYMTMIFVGSALLSFLLNKAHGADLLISLNFILVMNCVAAAFNNEDNRRGGLFFVSLLFSVILFINLIHYYCFNSFYGIAGNPNWFSAILCMTLPFFIYMIFSLVKNNYLKYGSLIIVCSLTLKALLAASSRASYLAIIIVILLFISRKLKIRNKLLILLFLFLVPLIATKLFPQKYEKFLINDIRKELWTSSAHVIKDNLLGVGQNNFKKAFPIYAQEGYKKHIINSDETTHPHNQFMLIAIENGLLASLALMLICLFLLNRAAKADRDEWPFLAAFTILLIQGFFDKALVMPPTSMAFALCAAYLWRNEVQFKVCDGCPNRKKYLVYISSLFSLLIIVMVARDLIGQIKYREGYIAFKSNKKDRFPQAKKDLEDAVKYKSRDLDFKYTLMRAYEQSLNLPNEALKESLEIDKMAPHYKRINRHLANINSQLNNKNEAELYSEKDLIDFPWDVNSLIDLINLKISLGKSSEIFPLVNNLDQIYEDRFIAYAKYYYADLKEFRSKWLNQKTFKEWYNFTDIRLRGAQYNDTQDKFFNNINKYPELASYYSYGFNKLDAEFWLEMQQINQLYSNKNRIQIFEEFKNKYTINDELKYSSPKESLKLKSLSSISYYSLLSVILRQRDIKSSLIMKENKCEGLVFIDQEKLKVFDFKGIRDFNTVSEKVELYSFYYPQNCALRNYMLSTTLNSDGNFYTLSVWPIIDIIEFNNLSGLRVKGVLPHPFAEMNNKLK
ncbi:O-antigen ligase family protein [Lentisphaera profundi]|uniref:O-antigen ligase family protein n=1 Tax=Lentisphaera profundi TaxID=1658616 RepID=A0ABY7VTQ0_9BACT|nr:O-antigen ligase family protein [Lentisphaera profundi]WDE96267.1 O-antigen ligase family protein [Lentisphaera profundi]